MREGIWVSWAGWVKIIANTKLLAKESLKIVTIYYYIRVFWVFDDRVDRRIFDADSKSPHNINKIQKIYKLESLLH